MIYLIIAFLGVFGQAGFFGQGSGFFSYGPWFLDDLNLPPEIMQQVQNLYLQHREKMIDLQANLQKQALNFQQILSKIDLTEKEFLQELDKISQLRDNLIKEKAIFLFNLKKILPPEEWEKLRDQFFERRRGGFFGPKGRNNPDQNFQRRNFRR